MWKFSYYFSAITKKIHTIFDKKIYAEKLPLTIKEKIEKIRLLDKSIAYKGLSIQKRRDIDMYIQKYYTKY
jgi:hypothetical protein